MVFLFLSEGGDMSKKNTIINYQIILVWEPLKIEMGSGGSAGKESNCNAGDWVPPLGWEDPLEEGWQPTPVFFSGESPWTEESSRPQSMGSQRVGHN